jgi:hypothetical protein
MPGARRGCPGTSYPLGMLAHGLRCFGFLTLTCDGMRGSLRRSWTSDALRAEHVRIERHGHAARMGTHEIKSRGAIGSADVSDRSLLGHRKNGGHVALRL